MTLPLFRHEFENKTSQFQVDKKQSKDKTETNRKDKQPLLETPSLPILFPSSLPATTAK